MGNALCYVPKINTGTKIRVFECRNRGSRVHASRNDQTPMEFQWV
jgi:hypothetical protein